jgi:predicted amino acid dehydrogenase
MHWHRSPDRIYPRLNGFTCISGVAVISTGRSISPVGWRVAEATSGTVAATGSIATGVAQADNKMVKNNKLELILNISDFLWMNILIL